MDESSIDVRSIIGLVQRQIRLILSVVFVGLMVAALYVLFKTPIYTAQTLVLVDPSSKNLLSDKNDDKYMYADKGRVESEVEIIGSPSTLLGVIADQQLVADPEFGVQLGWRDRLAALTGIVLAPGEDRPEHELQTVLTSFASRVDVARRGLTYLIEITVSSADPVKAANLANAVATLHIRQQLDAKVANALNVRDALGRRLSRASLDINEVEGRIDSFLTENMESIASESGRADIAAMRSQLEALKAQSVSSTAATAAVAELAGQKNWSTISEQLGSDAIRELDNKRQQLAANLAGVVEGSAEAIDLRARLNEIDSSLVSQVNTEVDRLRKQAEFTQSQESKVRDQIRSTVLASNLPNDLVVKLYQLQQEGDVSRSLYEGLLQRLHDVEAQADLQLPDSRIVSAAAPPTSPSAPRVRLIMALAFVVSLGLGVGLAFLNENYIGGFTSLEQLEAVTGLPALSSVPLISMEGKAGQGRADVVNELVERPLSAYSEAIRRARLGVETLAREGKAQSNEPFAKSLVVMVASAVPGEGKTTTAISLARSFALAGQRTLLVDCDLRRPAVAGAMNANPTIGLMDYLSAKIDRDNIRNFVTRDETSGLDLVLGGRRSQAPTDSLFASERFRRLLTVARESFDVVVLDTSPVLPVTDAQYLAPYADVIMMIVRWSNSSQNEVRAALANLTLAAGTDLTIGTVLTQMERDVTTYSNKYGYYYNS